MADDVQLDTSKQPITLEYQGIEIRFISILIDSIISWIFGLLIVEAEINNWISPLLGGLLWIGFFLVYFVYLEGSRGQTVGKMITKIKVVREDGGKIDMKQALIRNVLRIIDGIAFYLVGAIFISRSDKKQRLGDSVAKTVVVKI
jgi:uncharacterized RDD family membrane protein YckC